MDVVAWVSESTWPACLAALRDHVPSGARVTLLYVADDEVPAIARGALAGLLGRSRAAGPDPAARVRELAGAAGRELLDTASRQAGREVALDLRHGRVEREVVAAAASCDLLVVARDGDLSRLGPHSLAPATRFVVDHAPCAVLLVWPSTPPAIGSIPPPPLQEAR
ncbi:MAG TPA: universal stress protein [Cellulomonas sp.]